MMIRADTRLVVGSYFTRMEFETFIKQKKTGSGATPAFQWFSSVDIYIYQYL